MISYKLLTIFTVVIVIRSSCGKETDCEESLKEFGIQYDCGYLNYNFVRKSGNYSRNDYKPDEFYANFKKDNDIVSYDTRKLGYLKEYCDSVYYFNTSNYEQCVVLPSLLLEPFCQNRKKNGSRKEFEDKIKETIKKLVEDKSITPKKIKFNFNTLLGDVNACINEIIQYQWDSEDDIIPWNIFKNNPYKNIIMANEILNLDICNQWIKPKNMKGDTYAFILMYEQNIQMYTTKIQEYTNDYTDDYTDGYTDDDRDAYKKFIVSEFCKLYYPSEYQNEKEKNTITES